jgi:murein DD-endopeptidase MepM/ murein hydrolase activator NlpD
VLAAIPVGTMVRRGDHVGTVGEDTGHCGARPCVHFGLKRGDRYVDPLDWLEGYGRIVLLPRSAATRTRPWTTGSRAAS